MRRFFCRVEITVGPDKPPGDAGGKHQVKETKMGLFGKIATLAAIALPGKAIAASRGKTSAAGGTPPPPPPPAGGGVKAKTGGPGPGPGSIGGIAAPGGQVQGRQSSMNNAFRAGQPPAPPSGSGSGMSIWEAGSKRRANKANKTEL